MRLISVLFLLCTIEVTAEPIGSTPIDIIAEHIYNSMQKGSAKEMGQNFNAEMDSAFPEASREGFLKDFEQKYGTPEGMHTVRVESKFRAIYLIDFQKGSKLEMKLSLDEKSKVAGLFFTPPRREEAKLERNKTPLKLPFEGQMIVFWGGDTSEQNAHHNIIEQKYSFDLLGVDKDGKTLKVNAKGEKNEDYHCFGRAVLSPAKGTVVEAVDGIRDNVPGASHMNPMMAFGNSVVIKHSENEFSILAHLKRGSVRVRAGQKVSQGAKVGQCGNSGNSSEPHLHFHLQDSDMVNDAIGVKVFFADVKKSVEGKKESLKDYSPVKGEIISSK